MPTVAISCSADRKFLSRFHGRWIRYPSYLGRDHTPAISGARPDVGEGKPSGGYHIVDDNRAIDSAGDDGHVANHFYRLVGWFVLSVLPDVSLEEGHVLPLTRELTFETDVDDIIGQEFVQGDGILF